MAEFWQWQGDAKTGSGYITNRDPAGRQGLNTVFGDAIHASRITNINVQFQYNISSYDVNTTLVGTGSATQSLHQAILSTGVSATGSAMLESIDTLRYLPGHDGYALFTTEFSTPEIGSNQLIGIHDATDGFIIGFINTDFCVIRRKDSVDEIIKQTDFNLHKLNGITDEPHLNINFLFGNVWRINYGWLGHATIVFEVMSNEGEWIPFHRFNYPNSTLGTSIGNPVLPMRMEVTKTSGTANVTMKTGSWNAGVINSQSALCCNRYQSFAISSTLTSLSTLTNIFTLKSVSAFQTVRNKVRTMDLFLSASCDGTKLVSIKLIKNAILGATATYTFIDSANSTIQYDTTTTNVSGGTTLLALQLGKSDSRSIDLSGYFIDIRPTETLTFAAISTLTSDIQIATRWAEEF